MLSSGLISLIYNASRVKSCSIPWFDDANIRTSEVCDLAPILISKCFLTGVFFLFEVLFKACYHVPASFVDIAVMASCTSSFRYKTTRELFL